MQNRDSETICQCHDRFAKIDVTETKKNKVNSVSEAAKIYVSNNYQKSVNMAVISNNIDISYAYFSKIFKEENGMNFSDYVMEYRMKEATNKLKRTDKIIREVAASVGYDNPKHFTRAFKNYFGVSPQLYRKNYENSAETNFQ